MNQNSFVKKPTPKKPLLFVTSSSSSLSSFSWVQFITVFFLLIIGTLPTHVYGQNATVDPSPSPSSTAVPSSSPMVAPLFYENNLIVSGAMGYSDNNVTNPGTVEQYLYEISYSPSTNSFALVRNFPLPNSTIAGKSTYSNVLLGDDCNDYGGQLNVNPDNQLLITHGLNLAPQLAINQVKTTTERVYTIIDYTGTIQQYKFSQFTTSGTCTSTSYMTAVVPVINSTAGIYYAGGYPSSTAETTDGIFYSNAFGDISVSPIAGNPYSASEGDRFRYISVYANQLYATKSNGIYTIGTGLPTTIQDDKNIFTYAVYNNTLPATTGVTLVPDARGFVIYNLTYIFVADGNNGLIRFTYNHVNSTLDNSSRYDYIATSPSIGTSSFDKAGRAVTTMIMGDSRPYIIYTTKTAIYLYDIERLAWVTNTTTGFAISFPATGINTGLTGRVLTFRGIAKAPRSIRYSELFPTPSNTPTPSSSALNSPSASAKPSTVVNNETSPSASASPINNETSPSASASPVNNRTTPTASPINNETSPSASASPVNNRTTPTASPINKETSPSASPSSMVENNRTNGNATEVSPSANATNIDNNSSDPRVSSSPTSTPTPTASHTPDPSPVLKPVPVSVRIVQVSMVITLPSGNATNQTVYDAAALAGASAIANYLKVNVSAIIIIGLEPVYQRLSGSRLLQANPSPSTTPSASPTPSVTPSPGWDKVYALVGYSIKYGIDLSVAANSTTLIQWVNATNSSASSSPNEALLLNAITSLFSTANTTNGTSSTATTNGQSSFFSFLLADDNFAQSLGYSNASAAAPSLNNIVSSIPSTTVSTFDKVTMEYVKETVAPPTVPAADDSSALGAIIGGAAGGGIVVIGLIIALVWYFKCRTGTPITQGKLLSSHVPTHMDNNATSIIMNPLAVSSPSVAGPVRRHATMLNTFEAAGLTVRSLKSPGPTGASHPVLSDNGSSNVNVMKNDDQMVTIVPLSHLGRSNHSRMKNVLDVYHHLNQVRPIPTSSPSGMGDVTLSINPALSTDNSSKNKNTKKTKKKSKKYDSDSDSD